MSLSHRSGFAALIGRPNVGKSTLLNKLVGEKLAIVSPKPQTTRSKILGVVTRPEGQIAFLDTPGIHAAKGPLNKLMVELALQAAKDADVVLFLIEAAGKREDQVVEVGGKGTFGKSLRSISPGGQIHLVGGVSGFTSEVPLIEIIGKMAVVRGIYVGNREMFEAMNRAITLHHTKPVIDRVFAFADAPAAYRHQQSGAHFGKVVISVGYACLTSNAGVEGNAHRVGQASSLSSRPPARDSRSVAKSPGTSCC